MLGALDKNCQIDIQGHPRILVILVTDFVKNMETQIGFGKNAKTHYEKLREERIEKIKNYQANLKILLLLQNLKLEIEQEQQT